MKKWIVTGIVITAALNLWAQAPEMFRYQGRLVDGTNLVNATVPMSFKLYDALSGGNLLYEDSNSVLVVDGLYSTYIGDNTVFGSLTNAMINAAVYLELTVNGATLLPRERLVSVPYALNTPSAIPAPVNGDPVAVSNVVVTTRWTKNFYANGDITMSDNETGLMWLYDASLWGRTNWCSAARHCEDLTYAGYSDWRLPSKVELNFLFYSSEYFAGVCVNPYGYTHYWSGTYIDAGEAWHVSMASGSAGGGSKTDDFYVWPVRGRTGDPIERVVKLSGNLEFEATYTTYTGAAKTREFTIYNCGYATLTVTDIQYSDAHFSGNWSGTLQAGGSTNITVTLTPTAPQNYSGIITVSCDKTSGANSIAAIGARVATPYVDNGDGTVTDTTTGLMWMKNANLGYIPAWSNALTYCSNLVYAGYSDWRLPSVARDGGKAELDTLFRVNGNPAGAWVDHMGTPFAGVQSYIYWSSTFEVAHKYGGDAAWEVSMSDGGVDVHFIDGGCYVWPVRGGK